MYFLLFAINKL